MLSVHVEEEQKSLGSKIFVGYYDVRWEGVCVKEEGGLAHNARLEVLLYKISAYRRGKSAFSPKSRLAGGSQNSDRFVLLCLRDGIMNDDSTTQYNPTTPTAILYDLRVSIVERRCMSPLP